MIKMTNVYKEYPNGMKAIAGLTVNIKQGEFVYVVGPSGAGKSPENSTPEQSMTMKMASLHPPSRS